MEKLSVPKNPELEKQQSFEDDDFDDRASLISSVASMNSVTTNTNTKMQLDLFTQEIQLSAASKETPTIVKRLIFVLFVFFALVVLLIGLESMQFTNEVVDLSGRFQFIEWFNIRYELIIYLSLSPRSYDTYRRASNPAQFTSYSARTRTRVDRTTIYNLKVRQAFEQFDLDYDYQIMDITYGTEKYQASFNYALIKVFFANIMKI